MSNRMVESFLETTTLHGLKDVCRSPSKVKKWLWTSILVIFTIATLHGLEKICEQLYNRETVSSIEAKAPDDMPPVVLCPWHFENDSKVSALNITPAQLVYLKSYFFSAAPMKYHAARISQYMHPYENAQTVRKWFREWISDQTFGDVFGQILVDNLTLRDRHMYSYVQVDDEWSDGGRCSFLTRNQSVNFSVHSPKPYAVIVHDRATNMASRVGSFTVGWATVESGRAMLELDLRYERVTVLISRTTFVNLGCRQGLPAEAYGICMSNCRVRACGVNGSRALPEFQYRKLHHLAYNIADVYMGVFSRGWYGKSNLCFTAAAEACAATCPRSCAEHEYHVQVTTGGDFRSVDDPVFVVFMLLNPDKWLLFREVEVYDFMTAMSAVGGTISLFFGASLWTVVHAVSWMTENLVDSARKTVRKKGKVGPHKGVNTAAADAMASRRANPLS